MHCVKKSCHSAEEFLQELSNFNSERFIFRGQSYYGHAQPSMFYKEHTINSSSDFSDLEHNSFLELIHIFKSELKKEINNILAIVDETDPLYKKLCNLSQCDQNINKDIFHTKLSKLKKEIDLRIQQDPLCGKYKRIANLCLFFALSEEFRSIYHYKFLEFEALRQFLLKKNDIKNSNLINNYNELFCWLDEMEFFTKNFEALNIEKINQFIYILLSVHILFTENVNIDFRKLYYLFELARHYEVPMTVLDVTTSPEVAAFFATEGSQNGAEIKVYVIDKNFLNRMENFRKGINPNALHVNLIQRPKDNLSDRAKAQKAEFLWFDHNYKNEHEELPSLETVHKEIFEALSPSENILQLYIFTLSGQGVENLCNIVDAKGINKVSLYCLNECDSSLNETLSTNKTSDID